MSIDPAFRRADYTDEVAWSDFWGLRFHVAQELQRRCLLRAIAGWVTDLEE